MIVFIFLSKVNLILFNKQLLYLYCKTLSLISPLTTAVDNRQCIAIKTSNEQHRKNTEQQNSAVDLPRYRLKENFTL